MRQIIYGCLFITSLVGGMSCATVPIPVATGKQKKAEVAKFKEVLNKIGGNKLGASAIIREKPSRLFPGINKALIAVNKNNYNFPVGEILEQVISEALYTVFEPPDNNLNNTFFIDIYLDRFRLYHYGPSTKNRATCELAVRIKVYTPTGLLLTQKALEASSISLFNGKESPEAIWDACYKIGREFVKFVASSKEIHTFAGSTISQPAAVYTKLAPTPKPMSEKPIRRENDSSVKGQKWAVVVGIGNYKYAGDNQITNLRYADKDAKELAEFLKSPDGGGFDHVYTLLNEEVTYQNLRYVLFDYLAQAIEEDLVLFFFAGHGAPDPKEPDNLYLLTYDTHPDRVSSTAFPMWDVETALQRYIKAEKVILLTDACHSAGISGGVGLRGIEVRPNLTNKFLLKLARSRGRISFTASEANEQSHESKKWGGGHGVFTYFLLEGLKGKADNDGDKIVSLGELVDYTSENVRRATNSQQHPDTSGKFDRDLPLVIVK
jgi:hypothetical protein